MEESRADPVLKAVLPTPGTGWNYKVQTSIGCRIRGLKDGREKTYYIYNNCSHEMLQGDRCTGVSYTTERAAAIAL